MNCKRVLYGDEANERVGVELGNGAFAFFQVSPTPSTKALLWVHPYTPSYHMPYTKFVPASELNPATIAAANAWVESRTDLDFDLTNPIIAQKVAESKALIDELFPEE